jgi:hypothetical protein
MLYLVSSICFLIFSFSSFFAFFFWLFFNNWLFKRSWFGLYFVFLWIIVNHRWVNWEVIYFFIFVTISHIYIQISSLVVIVERSWPLERSNNNNSVGYHLTTSLFVFGTVAHLFDNPWLDFLVSRYTYFLVTNDRFQSWLIWVRSFKTFHGSSFFLIYSLLWFWLDMSRFAVSKNVSCVMNPHLWILHFICCRQDYFTIFRCIIFDVSWIFFLKSEKTNWAKSCTESDSCNLSSEIMLFFSKEEWISENSSL